MLPRRVQFAPFVPSATLMIHGAWPIMFQEQGVWQVRQQEVEETGYRLWNQTGTGVVIR
jgi:hypothetical protein